mgnify:CR=1 FL=1
MMHVVNIVNTVDIQDHQSQNNQYYQIMLKELLIPDLNILNIQENQILVDHKTSLEDHK